MADAFRITDLKKPVIRVGGGGPAGNFQQSSRSVNLTGILDLLGKGKEFLEERERRKLLEEKYPGLTTQPTEVLQKRALNDKNIEQALETARQFGPTVSTQPNALKEVDLTAGGAQIPGTSRITLPGALRSQPSPTFDPQQPEFDDETLKALIRYYGLPGFLARTTPDHRFGKEEVLSSGQTSVLGGQAMYTAPTVTKPSVYKERLADFTKDNPGAEVFQKDFQDKGYYQTLVIGGKNYRFLFPTDLLDRVKKFKAGKSVEGLTGEALTKKIDAFIINQGVKVGEAPKTYDLLEALISGGGNRPPAGDTNTLTDAEIEERDQLRREIKEGENKLAK